MPMRWITRRFPVFTALLLSCSTQTPQNNHPDSEAHPVVAPEGPSDAGDQVGAPAAAGDRPWVVGENGQVALTPPDRTGGLPLMQALAQRRSVRQFRSNPLPLRVLSELLWAAFGVNRDDGHRTAPSAWNGQEIDVYLAAEAGLFLYNAPAHYLDRVSTADIRARTGTQGFVATAPINLIYVADFTRMRGSSDEERMVVAAASAGAISENVYLYCASAGLATVVRGSLDLAGLSQAMGLRPDQHLVLAQSVGYPGHAGVDR